MEKIAASPDLIMFAARTQLTGSPDVVHLPVTDPMPVYPWSLLWHGLNRHPTLPLLIAHVRPATALTTSAASGCPRPTARCSRSDMSPL